MNDYPKYTNLELEINFVNEKSQVAEYKHWTKEELRERLIDLIL